MSDRANTIEISDALAAEATEPRLDELEKIRQDCFRLPGDTTIQCIVGYDPLNRLNEFGWSCFLLPGQAIPLHTCILGHDNQPVDLTALYHPYPSTHVKCIIHDNKVWTLSHDAWGNPSCYQAVMEERDHEYEDNFDRGLAQSVRIWEAASQGEAAVRRCIAVELGQEVLDNIDAALAILVQYPQLQVHATWTEHVDLLQIGEQATSVEEALELLRGEEDGFPRLWDFEASRAYARCQEIVIKLVKKQRLTPDDFHFINAVQMSNQARRYPLENTNRSAWQISEFTMPQILANIAEAFICRQIIGWDIFAEHIRQFREFTQAIGPESIPDSFSPARDHEFTWYFSLDDVTADGSGLFFIERKLTRNMILLILTHERMHRLVSTAFYDGLGRIFPVEDKQRTKFEESFADALVLLISYRGNAAEALANAERILTISEYKNGAIELLNIIQELETVQNEPCLGSILSIIGLQWIEMGKSICPTALIEMAYDQEIGKTPGAFRTRMQAYNDYNSLLRIQRFKGHSEDKVQTDTSRISEVIEHALRSIRWLDLTPRERTTISREFFEEYKEERISLLIKNPFELVTPTNNTLYKLALAAVASDPASAQQLRVYVSQEIASRTAALRRMLEQKEKRK